MVIAQSITLAIILILIIPTLYFVIRKANQRRGFGPAITIGIALPLIVINSLYQLITMDANKILRVISMIGAVMILIGVAWNASLDYILMNGIRYCSWPCCPNCCKNCTKYQAIDDNDNDENEAEI